MIVGVGGPARRGHHSRAATRAEGVHRRNFNVAGDSTWQVDIKKVVYGKGKGEMEDTRASA